MKNHCDNRNISHEPDTGVHLVGSRGFDEVSHSDQTTTSTDVSPLNSEHGTVPGRQSSTGRLIESLKQGSNLNLFKKTRTIIRDIKERKSDRNDDRRRIRKSKSFSPLDSSSHHGELNVTDVAYLPQTLLSCIEDRDPVQARKAKFWLKLVERQELAAEEGCPNIETYATNDNFIETDKTNLPHTLIPCMKDRDPVQARKAKFWLKLVEQQELEAEGKCPTNESPKKSLEELKRRECPSITIEESDNDECLFQLTAATS